MASFLLLLLWRLSCGLVDMVGRLVAIILGVALVVVGLHPQD